MARNATGAQAGQSLTDKVPTSDRGSTLGSTVATSENLRSVLHSVSPGRVPEGNSSALSVVPLITPEFSVLNPVV
jgi:hypothetical protein